MDEAAAQGAAVFFGARRVDIRRCPDESPRMAFETDSAILEDIVRSRDPAFRTADPGQIAAQLRALRHAADVGADSYLLSAMRLLALGGNGHSRVVPNVAIRVMPLRFVAIGASIYLTDGAAPEVLDRRLVAVNGAATDKLLARAAPLLAGTSARQRAIGAILLGWPAALKELGAVGDGRGVRYLLAGRDGEVELAADPSETVPAPHCYPEREHGGLCAAEPEGSRWADCTPLGGAAWHIRLPGFDCDDGTALEDDLGQAARLALSEPRRALVFDLRGNRGGDFLKTLPFLEAIVQGWRGRAAAVLVDKFTFSAAIVFVAILTRRLDGRITILGEAMGDGTRFHAEGGTEALPETGAVVRYSTAFHDWQTGRPDATTPPEIARHLVAAGQLLPGRTVDITARDLRLGRDPPLAAAREMMGV